jgi:hypothetical protein
MWQVQNPEPEISVARGEGVDIGQRSKKDLILKMCHKVGHWTGPYGLPEACKGLEAGYRSDNF